MSMASALIWSGCVFVVLCGICLAEDQPAGGKHVKLLSIGNSFSVNASRFLPELVKASGNTLTFGHACIGGCSYAGHWKPLEIFEANPDDPNGRPYSYGDRKALSLKDMLTAEQWDYVTIQQVSWESYKLESHRPHAKLLYDYIRKHAPQAEVLIHETWAYQEDDPLFTDGFMAEKMHGGLRTAYHTIARALGCRVIPVGDAIQLARHSPDWRYVCLDPNYDFRNPQHPALPDQSHLLTTGWFWSKQQDGTFKLGMDGHHANSNGEYLGGCVWFEFLYGQSVVGNTCLPKNVTEPDVLQKIAHQAVAAAQQEKESHP